MQNFGLSQLADPLFQYKVRGRKVYNLEKNRLPSTCALHH